MGRKCWVPNCKSGYDGQKEKISIFKAPNAVTNEELLSKWQKAIPREDRKLSENDYVCEKHFQEDQIIRAWEFHGVREEYKRPKLKEDAIPSIFPNCPSYLSKTLPKKRRLVVKHDNRVLLNKKMKSINIAVASTSDNTLCYGDISMEDTSTLNNSDVTSENVYFLSLWHDTVNIQFPNSSWACHRTIQGDNEKYLVFSSVAIVNSRPVFEKQLLVRENGSFETFIALQKISDNDTHLSENEKISDLQHLTKVLYNLEATHICYGVASEAEDKSSNSKIAVLDNVYNCWRHTKCKFFTANELKLCSFCKRLKMSINATRKRKSSVLSRLQIYRKRHNNLKYRTKTKLQKLKNLVEVIQKKYEVVCNKTVADQIDILHLPQALKNIITECLRLGKFKTKTSRRYSSDWLLSCLLLYIRGRGTYQYLLRNDILPLPSVSTMRKYLNYVRIQCGLDKHFFEALALKMKGKSELQRHGILVFDEMSVRCSLNVNVRTMTYDGIVDFGEEINKDQTEMKFVDHALVFMFTSLGEKFHQPVAVYGAKGPTKGTVLAKLCLQIVMELEKAGCYVDGIVCDGATTNKKMWSEFGVSGCIKDFQNKILHPSNIDSQKERYLYFLSDAPHLIKCVRNRLQNMGTLIPPEGQISWDHYQNLFEEDTKLPAHLRVCPKITHAHVYTTHMMKMRVKLATQIFSNSVVHGLTFYSNKNIPNLQETENTIKFTKRMNDMFDVLNRKTFFEGVRLGSPDFEIMDDCYNWLCEWEQKFSKNSPAVLTNVTMEGLRVTLKSTKELTMYLLNSCKFDYVLTCKMNQDCLEHFFGITRQAGGNNDHPTFTSFLHLYRILSTYTLIKPPKYGNCTITTEESSANKITIADLKSIFVQSDVSPKEHYIANIKAKIEGLLDDDHWENSDADFSEVDACGEENNSQQILDCVVYYVAGFVCKTIRKSVKCAVCLSFFTTAAEDATNIPDAELTLIKTWGRLVHPNINLHNMLKNVEKYLSVNIHTPYGAYQKTLDEYFEHEVPNVPFPCNVHKSSIIANVIHYYILLRMRHFCKQEDALSKKKSRDQKKQSKLLSR